MSQSHALDLISTFRRAARRADERDDEMSRQAAVIIRKVKARNDADDREVWRELRDRLGHLGHETAWMADVDPTDDPHNEVP